MRLSTDKRNKNRTVYSRAFGVLVVLWASLGIQPCAVAAVDDAGCPHCPPEQGQPMATHGSLSDGMTESSPCVSAASIVCEVDEAAIDSRIGKIEADDAGTFVVAAPAMEPIFPVASDAVVGVPYDPPARRRSAVPLHILYCVYRD